MKFTKIFLLTGFCSCFLPTQAQITFEMTYGGNIEDVGQDLLQTNDGNFVFVSGSYVYNSPGQDVYLTKIDYLGDTLWSISLGIQTYYSSFLSLDFTLDGNIIVTAGNKIVKVNENGEVLWNKTLNGIGWSIAHTSDSCYIIVAGNSLIKTNTFGDTLWKKSFSLNSDGALYDVLQTFDGGFAAIGQIEDTITSETNAYLIKTNEFGDTIWTKQFGGSNGDGFSSVIQTSDSGFMMVGYYDGYSTGLDVFIVKTDSVGDMIWQKKYDFDNNWDAAYSVKEIANEGYIITGYSTISWDISMFLVNTDKNGNFLWQKFFGGTHDDRGRSVIVTQDGGFAVVGQSKSFNSGNYDVYLIKTDSLGNIYPTYNQSQISNLTSQISISPNPLTSISTFDIQNSSTISTIEIFDLLGRKIKTISNRGNSKIVLHKEDFQNGCYIYQATDESGKSFSGKFVVM